MYVFNLFGENYCDEIALNMGKEQDKKIALIFR